MQKLTNSESLARALSILDQEIEAIEQLKLALEDSLFDALKLVLACTGRFIVTGVGKSGHIGAKLAATFASTGTPSFFLHAAEASHGDLGMITDRDVVLAISNSGTTRELFPILDYCTAHAVPVIGMTSNKESRLGTQSTICLRLPNVREACPNNLAPTTSVIVTLALGHVLAVLLMEHRSFVGADFAEFHPGGKLGLQLSSVRKYSEQFRDELPCVEPNEDIGKVLIKIAQGRRGCVIVKETGTDRLRGIITEGDLRRAYAPDMFDKKAKDIMSSRPVTIAIDELMSTAVKIMRDRRIGNLVVMDGEDVADVLHIKDIIQRGYM